MSLEGMMLPEKEEKDGKGTGNVIGKNPKKKKASTESKSFKLQVRERYCESKQFHILAAQRKKLLL